METYTVYVMTNNNEYIIKVNSSAFLADTAGWVAVDKGSGDRYHHAQGNYFPEPILTGSGVYRYKLVDGKPKECTPEEIQEQEEANQPEPTPSQEERIKALKEELAAAKIILGVE